MGFRPRASTGPGRTAALAGLAVVVLLAVPLTSAGPSAASPGTPHPMPVPSLPSPPTRASPSARLPDGPLVPDRPTFEGGLARTPALPFAWHGQRTPPGAEVLAPLRTRAEGRPAPGSGEDVPSGGSNNSSVPCAGIWPSEGGQAQYLPNCYGHDEPGITGYSTLGGSGGNVTWTTTLPVGTALGAMQSDLFTAIWYGMPLTDPYAWLDACYLELQFYPDSSFTSSGSSLNQWVGEAVAWQIEAVSGAENTCFDAPLMDNGSSGTYLTMHGGDRVVVTMSGWTNSSAGEGIQILDQTDREFSSVVLYNATARYPLDPSYGTASWVNALQWTPGGELPATFAFETGHPAAPYPNNNSYGGCSAGWPPPTPTDPAVPCPSYDPGSWINDTVAPYEIAAPTFFNATASAPAVQIAFTQDLGGIAFIDPISGGTCDGRDGSAWCSYPWYSYSCAEHAFNFGATDWPSTSADFGKFGEFATTTRSDRGGFEYYPPTNVSLPGCGAPSYRVTVSAPSGASAYFLNDSVAPSHAFAGLLPGEYSISASPSSGLTFAGWVTTGSVEVEAPDCPATSLVVTGNGTVAATVSAVAPTTATVEFLESDANASVQVAPGVGSGGTAAVPATRTIGAGGLVDLVPGTYSLESLPSPGTNFSRWELESGPAVLAATEQPYTWLTVLGTTTPIVVKALTVASDAEGFAYVYPYATGISSGPTGNASGAIEFDGLSYGLAAFLQFPVGTYEVSEHPARGSVFAGWYLAGISGTLDFSNSTSVVLENGTAYVEAAFAVAVNLTLATSGGTGSVELGGSGWLASGSRLSYGTVPRTEPLAAEPPAGASFADWTLSDARNLSVANLTSEFTQVAINGSGTITAHFVAASSVGLAFAIGPVTDGAILLDGVRFASGATDAGPAPGLYLAQFAPGPQEGFGAWALSGALSAVAPSAVGWPNGSEILDLAGAGATVGAVSAPATSPVTFLSPAPSGHGPSFVVNGSAVPFGGTVNLGLGSIPVSFGATGPHGVPVWTTSGGVSALATGGASSTIEVNGSGTVYLTLGPPLDVTAFAAPDVADGDRAPLTVQFAANVTGGQSPYTFVWQFGDGTPGASASAPAHVYNQSGIYGWSLTVQDRGGVNSSTVNGVVVVGGPPLAISASATPVLGEPPLDVRFSSGASGGATPYRFSWWLPLLDLRSASANLSGNFTAPGTYEAYANVSDGSGFFAQSVVPITVVPPIEVVGTASPERGRVPLNVSFSAYASDGYTAAPYTYNWSFGDGTFAAGPVGTHEYTSPGNFTLLVTARDSLGYLAQQSFGIEVLPPLPPLAVTLTAAPSAMVLGNASTIVALATGGTGAGTYTYRWTGVPTDCLPPATRTADSFVCQPSVAGDWVIGVNVSDAAAHFAANSTSLTVTAPPVVAPPINATAPASGLPRVDELLLAGAALAIAVVAVLAVVLRRRPPRLTGELPPEDEAPGWDDLPASVDLTGDDAFPSLGEGEVPGPPDSGP